MTDQEISGTAAPSEGVRSTLEAAFAADFRASDPRGRGDPAAGEAPAAEAAEVKGSIPLLPHIRFRRQTEAERSLDADASGGGFASGIDDG